MFTCHFPSESFISPQPQGPQHQPKLSMGLKLYAVRPRPSLRRAEACLCKRVRVCAGENRCVLSRINDAIHGVTK